MSPIFTRSLALVGAAALTALALPAATAQAVDVPGCPDYNYEPDDTMGLAWHETYASSWTNHAFCAVNDQDWKSFEVQAGKTYQVQTRDLASGVDTFLTLYRGGTRVATDDDSGDGLASSITFTAATNETYYVMARELNNAASTTYTYTMTIGEAPDLPVVTIKEPAPGQENVSLSNDIRVTFDEQVGGINGSTFQLFDPWGQLVPADVGYNAAYPRAWLNPHSNLYPDSWYYVVLNPGILDTDWNQVEPQGWSFRTARIVAPELVTQSPAPTAVDVPIANNVTATFSEPVLGVSGTSFQLFNSAGVKVPATVSYNGTSRTATLNPSANLAGGQTFRATLTGGNPGIRSATGVPLSSREWTFTTASVQQPLPGLPAPTVTRTTPANGATAVARTANATAVFSEPVKAVNGTNVKLTTASGAAVSATVAYNATTRTMTLNPGPTLAANTQYRVTLRGGTTAIRDATDIPLVTTSWTFTTGR